MTERADLVAHLAAAEQCLREYLIVVERIDTDSNSLSPEQTAFVRSAHALGKRGLDAILRYRDAMQRGRRWRMRRAWRELANIMAEIRSASQIATLALWPASTLSAA